MKSLLKNISIYFIGNIINRMMGFIVILIATHTLEQSDLGLFVTHSNLINMILTLASAQIWMAIIRFIFDYKSIKNKIKIISTGYFIQTISFAGYSIIYMILVLCKIIKNCPFELFLMSFGYVFNQNVQFACRGLEKNKLYVISGIVGSIAQLASFNIFVFAFKLTYNAIILATTCSYLFQGFFIEFFLKSFKHIKLEYVDLATIKKMLKYSVPTTFNFISYWLNQSANSVILNIGLGAAATGIFSTAYKMNSLIGLFIMSFNFAFQEFSFNVYKHRLKQKLYNNTFNYFVRFMSCSILILMPMTLALFSFAIGPKYAQAKLLIPLLYLGSIFDAVQNFLGSILQAEKKVNQLFMSQFFGSIISTITLISTMKILGTQSAGFTMVICFFAVCVLRFIALKPKIKLNFNLIYFVHYIPMFALTVLIYLKCSLMFNLVFMLFLFAYCGFVTSDLIKKLLKKLFKEQKIKKQ